MSIISILGMVKRALRYVKNGPEKETRICEVGLVHGKTLEGKTVLITGGSTGIGYAMATKFIAEGARVIVTGRSEDRLLSAKQKSGSDNFLHLVWDITNVQSIPSKMAQLRELAPNGVDVLVNNAGVAMRQKFGELTEENWNCVYDTNLKGLVFLTQAFVNDWLQHGKGGVILNTASMAAYELNEDAYSSSKSALVSLTRGLAKKYAPLGIRINSIAPGVVVGTELNVIQRQVKPDGDVKCSWIPAGRYAVPEEIAELATFMIGDASSYIYGQTIVCDGAKTL